MPRLMGGSTRTGPRGNKLLAWRPFDLESPGSPWPTSPTARLHRQLLPRAHRVAAGDRPARDLDRLHLWDNLSAFGGAQAWERSVTAARHPLHQALLVVVVLLPLVLHTVWGIVRLASSRPNNARYGNYDNLKYLLQRLSAIGLLGFIGAHLWLAWAQPRFVEGRPEPFAEISHEMAHHTPTLVVYILGILAVSYHLANGVQTFAMGRGWWRARGRCGAWSGWSI
jgi:succinate dehydrogenase / fumarate reductase cytochrome b subunit